MAGIASGACLQRSAVLGVMAVAAALTVFSGSARAGDMEKLSLSAREANAAITAQIVLPGDLAAGGHDLLVTSCWGGPDNAYPEDGSHPVARKAWEGASTTASRRRA